MQTHQEKVAATVPSDTLITPTRDTRSDEFLLFRLGAETYAVRILCVQEIRSFDASTRIANDHAFVEGVVNLRGIIVPIFDLRIKFDLERVNYDSHTVVIVVKTGEKIVGVVADAVIDVLSLDLSQIRPLPKLSAAVNSNFMTGFGTVPENGKEKMIIMVDMLRFIQSLEGALSLSEVAN